MFLDQATGAANEPTKPTADKLSEVRFDNTWLAEKFAELVPQSEIRWIIYVAGFLMLVTVSVWVVLKIKGYSDYAPATDSHLPEFEDLYERGAFSDEEMARLKIAERNRLKAATEANATTDPDKVTETDSDSTEQPAEKETEKGFEINKPR